MTSRRSSSTPCKIREINIESVRVSEEEDIYEVCVALSAFQSLVSTFSIVCECISNNQSSASKSDVLSLRSLEIWEVFSVSSKLSDNRIDLLMATITKV